VHSGSLGSALGVYVAGNSLGGVAGRLIAAAAGDDRSWRIGVFAVGVLAVLAAAVFSLRIPEPVRFRPVPLRWDVLRDALAGHLRDSGIIKLCVIAFLLMGSFVAAYNYLGYRLLAHPFNLSQGLVGLVFLAYLAGTVSSIAAGRLTDRRGPKPTLIVSIAIMTAGLLLTVPDLLGTVIAGIVIFTAGFFGAHAVASGWVSQRATGSRAQASALYLLAYYAGSGVLGSLTGVAYSAAHWSGVVIAALCYIAAAVALGVTIRSPRAV
jgi:YNFM family putative membrane transporter